MPYDIRKVREGKWIVFNKETKETKGTHESRESALKQMRLLYHVEAGGKLTRTKK